MPKRTSRTIVSALQTHRAAKDSPRNIHPNDIVLVYETASIANRFFDMAFQHRVKTIGARYIPIFPDAWPLTGEWLARCCKRRVALADVVGCVTPNLVDLFKDLFPNKPIKLFEEAIPSDAFAPIRETKSRPCICWSGPPSKIREVERMLPLLESIYPKHPFSLRIISGEKPPSLSTSIPLEWRPFAAADYRSSFQDSDIAFALYTDSTYGRCKGNYKVKTYLAAGCAVVTSPIGYNRVMIQQGINGFFASTPDEWKSAFLRLLRNPDERLSIRKAARETAVSKFSFEAISKQYLNALRETDLLPH